jgi:hypothetical protein
VFLADFQNQGAQEIAKLYDAGGKRTIGALYVTNVLAIYLILSYITGVLTKPDRIPAGDEQTWISLIKNERERLDNGWYCVKQPSSQELKRGITWSQARQREDEFFSTKDPWSNLDPIHQKYLRTENLVERLGSILSDLIGKRCV